jgi:hypothetical protein
MGAGVGQYKTYPVVTFTDIAGGGRGFEYGQQHNGQNRPQDDQGHGRKLFQAVSQGRNPLLIAILICRVL